MALVTIKDSLASTNTSSEALSAYQGYRLSCGTENVARDATKLPTAGGAVTGPLTLRDNLILSSGTYGSALPNTGLIGRLYFLKQENNGAVSSGTILDFVYPVGSIYMSTNSTSPGTLFGGSWTAITGGTMLIAQSSTYTAGSTGGVATHTHTTPTMSLTSAQLPVTSGYIDFRKIKGTSNIYCVFNNSNGIITSAIGGGGSGTGSTVCDDATSLTTGITDRVTVKFGSGSAHGHGDTNSGSTLPPYLSVYMWKRTS